MSSKIFDITTPADKWEEGYAHLEYLRTGIKAVGAKNIPVDAALVVSKSGCYFTADRLVHTDNCSCDDEYDEVSQNELE